MTVALGHSSSTDTKKTHPDRQRCSPQIKCALIQSAPR